MRLLIIAVLLFAAGCSTLPECTSNAEAYQELVLLVHDGKPVDAWRQQHPDLPFEQMYQAALAEPAGSVDFDDSL